MATICR